MDQRRPEASRLHLFHVDAPLSPSRGAPPAHFRRRRVSARSTETVEHGKPVGSINVRKHVSPASPETENIQTIPRALYGSHAAGHQATENGLYTLTGQLLLGCYLFVGFHAFLLQFYPDAFSHLRHPPSFGHPLMLLPKQGALLGWFFLYINGSVQQFVMRGVLGCLIFICLLHLVRVVLYPVASGDGRHTVAEDLERTRETPDPQKRAGVLRRLLRTAWSAQRRFHRRRERFCAQLVAVVCLGLTVVQTSSFFFGGWSLKAIGFPDIYLGALTKPGGLWGHETATDIVMEHVDMALLSPEDLNASLAELEEPRNHFLLVLILFIGFALDAWGQYLQVKAIRLYLSRKMFLSGVALFVSVLFFASINLEGVPSCNSDDGHWVDFSVQQELEHMTAADGSYLAANPPLMYSEYLLMRDGVRLAADVYLPYSFEGAARSWALLQHKQHVLLRAAEEARKRVDLSSKREAIFTIGRLTKLLVSLEKILERLREEEEELRSQIEGIPVYLEITRYNRRSEHFWPFTLLSIWKHPRGSSVNVWSWQTQQTLSANNYAVVIVDTRGSGASFGSRAVDLGEDELKDAAELVKWSKKQWFSNGRVAGGGLSYDGMLGLSMAAGGGVDAVISLFTPMDVMGELVAPGGLLCHSFLNDYTGLTNDFERYGTPWRHMIRNPLQFPFHVLMGFMLSFGGTSAVLGHEEELPHAIRSHLPNWRMTDVVTAIQFYDDEVHFSKNLQAAATSFGVTEAIMKKLADNNVSLLMVSGFCDSANVRGAVRLFSYMQKNAPESRPQLVLGNWSHGGRRTCDPYGGNFSCFETDLYSSLLRFFDCRLKNKCWGGIEDEAPVHFWQTGSSEWRTAQQFPPGNGMKHMDMQLTDRSVRDAPLNWEGAAATEPAKAVDASPSQTSPGTATVEGDWVPHVLDPLSSSFEHTLHDITQRVQLCWNMLELHEEARISAELMEGTRKTNTFVPNKRLERSWLSKFLSAVMAAIFSSNRHRSAGRDLREIFSHDENAYFLELPPSGHVDTATINSAPEKDVRKETYLDYTVEYLSSTGEYSRWTIAQHPFRLFVNYGNRLFQRKKRPEFTLTLSPSTENAEPFSLYPYEMDHLQAKPLCFVTEPLSEAVEMIGSAFLHLTIAVKDCTEVSMFAYIEDLDIASGYSHYVAEGKVVASNRPSKIQDDLPVGAYGRIVRSFFRHDHKPVDKRGEDVLVSLDFEPNAWTFQKGHSIRLVLTGSDVDNFSLTPRSDVTLPRTWRVITSSAFLSLPVLNHSHD